MAWVAVDKDGSEWIYNSKPHREDESWVDDYLNLVPLPKGAIKKLIGKELGWEDNPEEVLFETNINMSEKEERINAITAEIQKGINEAREAIKRYGATIPKSDIVVIIKDGKGKLEVIKSITV